MVRVTITVMECRPICTGVIKSLPREVLKRPVLHVQLEPFAIEFIFYIKQLFAKEVFLENCGVHALGQHGAKWLEHLNVQFINVDVLVV